LPIGFGRNQGDREYQENVDQGKYLYGDALAPSEAQFFAKVHDAYAPLMTQWLGLGRTSPSLIITSATTAHASFANFITDAIELQTMGRGDRDLLLHEMTHYWMYEHFHNFLGPAGSLIYLPWLPAWWIEGMAEVLSVSNRSDQAAAIERLMARNQAWPTFDRLHSLYHEKIAFEGYAISGNFVRYILKKMDTKSLGPLLVDLRNRVEPWWWPWTIVPGIGKLPLDSVLLDRLGKTSEQLYEEYKKEASEHWSRVAGFSPTISRPKGVFKNSHSGSGSFFGIYERDGQLFTTMKSTKFDAFFERPLDFWNEEGKRVPLSDPQARTAREKAGRPFPKTIQSRLRSLSGDMQVYTSFDVQVFTGARTPRLEFYTGTKRMAQYSHAEAGSIAGIIQTKERVTWLEHNPDISRLCFLEKSDIRQGKVDATCPIRAQMPHSLRFLEAKDYAEHDQLLIAQDLQSIKADWFRILQVDLRTMNSRLLWEGNARPLSATRSDKHLLLLLAEQNRQALHAFNQGGQCDWTLPLIDFTLQTWAGPGESIYLGSYHSGHHRITQIDLSLVDTNACYIPAGSLSPLLAAMGTRESQPSSFADLSLAMAQSDLWADNRNILDQRSYDSAQKEFAKLPMPMASVGTESGESPSQEAAWRARPIFLFPWIGAEDVYGTQLGLVSVPLMDHLQNETLRLSMLYGVESQFPSTDLMLISNRFFPTLTLSAFRQQSYNGSFRGNLLYYDEKGVRYAADLPLFFPSHRHTFSLFGKASHLTPYLGPSQVRKGRLNEMGLNWSWRTRLGPINTGTSLQGLIAPEAVNEEFDYNRLGGTLDLGLPLGFWSSSLQLGLEGGRTRGKARRFLMEVYRPLKTFVPGSGGGYNQNNFRLAGDGSMFGAQFGDSFARAKTSYTMPVIKDLDKQVWILYMERLDFTAFYNYGGAWFGDNPDVSKLISAHGYNLDLQLENKGVRINLGSGIGQVFGHSWDIYLTAGFDALF
jgi:hypothetical protein